MTNADEAQQRHDLGTALNQRLAAIRAGKATWQDHHQVGVLLSALAYSAQLMGVRDWPSSAARLLHQALDHYATAYYQLDRQVTDDRERRVLKAGVNCDWLLATARLARSGGNGLKHLEAVQGMQEVYTDLTQAAIDAPDVRHQLAIIQSFAGQMAFGSWLGFAARPDVEKGETLGNRADYSFGLEREKTPDNERAYRSHLLAFALAYDAGGKYLRRISLAWTAAKSARIYNDKGHFKRALAVMLLGRRGERIARQQRGDAQTIIDFFASTP